MKVLYHLCIHTTIIIIMMHSLCENESVCTFVKVFACVCERNLWVLMSVTGIFWVSGGHYQGSAVISPQDHFTPVITPHSLSQIIPLMGILSQHWKVKKASSIYFQNIIEVKTDVIIPFEMAANNTNLTSLCIHQSDPQ